MVFVRHRQHFHDETDTEEMGAFCFSGDEWRQLFFPVPSRFPRPARRQGTTPRPSAAGLVDHALKRGNDRDADFTAVGDFQAFLDVLAKTKERYPFRLFAYCLIP